MKIGHQVLLLCLFSLGVTAVTVFTEVKTTTPVNFDNFRNDVASTLRRYLILQQFTPGVAQSPSVIPTTIDGAVSVTNSFPFRENEVLQLEFASARTAQLYFYLANQPDELNPFSPLNVIAVQQAQPITTVPDKQIPIAAVVVVCILAFLLLAAIVALTLRRRMLRQQRTVNFSELIALEMELQARCDANRNETSVNL
jgi:hypothetical protein